MSRTLAVFIIFYCGRVLAVTNSLEIFQTCSVPEQNRTNVPAVVLVNGVRFMPFNGSNGSLIRNTEVNYWTQRMQGERWDFKYWWSIMNKDDYFNHTQGVHTVQWMYSCEWNDDNYTPRAMLQYAYDGEEFMSLNVESATWNTSSSIKSKWDMEGRNGQAWKHFLEIDCITHLRMFANGSREFLDWKNPPTALVFQNCSSSPEVVCHATGFFPNAVMISWRKDGEDVHENVELRETLPNQDGSFQKRSILKVTAEELQNHNYSCIIHHSGREKEMPVSNRQMLRDEGLCDRPEEGADGGLKGVKIVYCIFGVFALVAVVAIPGIVAFKKWPGTRRNTQEVQQNRIELQPLETSPSDAPV